MRFSNGLFSSMEEIDNTPEVIAPEEAAEVAVTVADDSAEIQSDGDEVAVSVSEIEQVVQAGEELEAVGEVAVDAVESGDGLDEKAAELTTIAIESILNKIGVRDASAACRLFVAESASFGASQTRLSSTKMIVEGIGDWLKKVWTAIKAGAARLFDKIKTFLLSIFKSADMLGKHIAGLKARVSKISAEAKKKEETLKSSGLVKAFGVDKKASPETFKKIFENTAHLSDVAKQVADLGKGVVDDVLKLGQGEMSAEAIKSFLESKAGKNIAMQKALAAGFKTYDGSLADLALPRGEQAEGTEIHAFGPFVNGAVLTIGATKKGEGAEAFIGLAPVKAKDAGDEVVALDKSGMTAILAQCETICKKLVEMKKTESVLETTTKDIQKTADTIIKNAEKLLDKSESSADLKKALAECKNSVVSTNKILSFVGGQCPTLQYNLAKAGADYVSQSIRNLS